MISKPIVTVTYDMRDCDYSEEFNLTATARDGYDERNLKWEMERNGWIQIDGKDICEDCYQDMTREEDIEETQGE